jgi:hypothetical protein
LRCSPRCYYDPGIGRYVSADPIGQYGGLAVREVALSRISVAPGGVNLLAQLDQSIQTAGLMPSGQIGDVAAVAFFPNSADANLYIYGLANPVIIVDPTGELRGELMILGGTIVTGVGLYTLNPWLIGGGGALVLGGVGVCISDSQEDATKTGEILQEKKSKSPQQRQLDRIMEEP